MGNGTGNLCIVMKTILLRATKFRVLTELGSTRDNMKKICDGAGFKNTVLYL